MREWDDPRVQFSHRVWQRMKELARSPALTKIDVLTDELKFICEANKPAFYISDIMYSDDDTEALAVFCKYIREKEKMALSNNTDFCWKADYMSSSTNNAASALGQLATTLGTYTTDRTDYVISPDATNNWGSISMMDYSNAPALKLTEQEVQKLKNIVNNKDKNDEVKKENNNMFNFDFGKVNGADVRYSTYGLAVKGVDGRYVAYDANSKSIMDVDVLNMPAGDFLFKMPVAIKDVKIGDIVIHNRAPMYVMETAADHLLVMDIRESTSKNIYPIKSPFGFNFITKVVSIVDMGSANADTPFGNMWPLLMANGSGKIDDILPMMMMANGMNMDMSNPMLMYFLMKDNKSMGDMALPLMMMAMNKPAAPVAQQMTFCDCGQPIK